MIYFITARDLNMVKIGYSANPHMRLVKVRADCPVPVLLEAVLDGGRNEETALHYAFSECRVRGEWFHITAEIEQCMTSKTKPVNQPRIQRAKLDLISSAPDGSGLLEEILAFCADHHMAPTTFGDLALNDRPFVTQLDRGREARSKTIAKCRSFMATYRTESAAA